MCVVLLEEIPREKLLKKTAVQRGIEKPNKWSDFRRLVLPQFFMNNLNQHTVISIPNIHN